MLYRKIIAVFSKIHIKHIITLCGQKVEILDGRLEPTEAASSYCHHCV